MPDVPVSDSALFMLLPPLIPLLTAACVLIAGNRTAVRDAISVAGACLTLVCVLFAGTAVMSGNQPDLLVVTLYPGIALRFTLDGVGLLFAVTSAGMWVMAALYSIGYMRALSEHAQSRFYFFYAIALSGGLGVACAGNLFTLYLFYELITISTYPLVAHHQDKKSYAGARKYLVYLMFTSKAFLLPAMAILYTQCGTLDFNLGDISTGVFPAASTAFMVSLCYVLFILGLAKAALMPLHGWLPAAMVAPAPVSALLHAVVVVKVGVFCMCRIMLSVFGTEMLSHLNLGLLTAYAAMLTILIASLIALTKTDLKARLAYSTVSQLSYIILGVALLSRSGIIGGLFHIPAHAVSKITLFFCAGAVFAMTGKKDIREMGGLGLQVPWVFAAFGLAALSMIGVPPVSGFISKWYLAFGTLEIHSRILLTGVLLSSLLNAVYFIEVIVRAFYGRSSGGAPVITCARGRSPVLMFMMVPLLATAVLSVLLGLWPDAAIGLIVNRILP
jgi:multicomponent Na+:H+ antiporter subunit D